MPLALPAADLAGMALRLVPTHFLSGAVVFDQKA
jgi:hypothetical protein